MIHIDAPFFHLRSRETSYILHIGPDGQLLHTYWGPRLKPAAGSELTAQLEPLYVGHDVAFSPNFPGDRTLSLDVLPREYPDYGRGDFRSPAFEIYGQDGTAIARLQYASHTVTPGKPALPGLPATYVEAEAEAQTLEIILRDPLTQLTVHLSYTVFEQLDVITRSARIVNGGTAPVRIQRALSANIDFSTADFDMIQLSGAWARERHIVRTPLRPGIQSVESRRGASSPQQNPFLALVEPSATEETGRAYGINLVYSGNFLAQAEVDQLARTRLSIGINPFGFAWHLAPGAAFQTPEAVLVFSNEGLGGLSQRFHRLYRTRLCRGVWRDKLRPILINNWEATYFNFDAAKIEAIADTASRLGIELFVLDDGWFGKRDSDNCSLGDWTTDLRKLPQGLPDLARRITAKGMQFGLWFEPEMVSPDSDLYRAHPDWCLHVPGRDRTEGRNQLVLDLSRQDVCDYLFQSVSSVLASAPITFVKWDMNRHMTEIGSAALPPELQSEIAHRYMLGLYSLLERITSAFPEILFESCAGGGGRFDPGMLFYMPQTWTSDNTDAIARLQVQYGTSLLYPASTVGAHVSASPNHQVGRITSITTRGHVAMSGNFGYQLDINSLGAEEQEAVRQQIATYKELRGLVQTGTFHRLRSPFDGSNEAAWMIVSEDQSEAIVFHCNILARPNPPAGILRLRGLDPAKRYHICELGKSFDGDFLHHAGLRLPDHTADFQTVLWRLKAE